MCIQRTQKNHLMRITTLILILLLSPLLAFGQASENQSEAQKLPNPDNSDQLNKKAEKDSTFNVNVRLVGVYATVTDQQGRPVTDLKKEQFVVTEDGLAQTIAVFEQESERPVSIMLALDTSGSVRKDLKLEMESARRFVGTVLRRQDALSLYSFSENVSELVPFTSDLKRITHGISNIRMGAGTALYDTIYLGGQALAPRDGRKVMVLITDGGDTFSSTDYATAVRAAQQAEAIVYSIIMVPIEADAGRNTGGEHALIQLSLDTGGKHYYASSTEDLDQDFALISKELRTQYLIGYYTNQRRAASDFRRIAIQVNPLDSSSSEKYKARHRTGYYTSKLK